MDTRTFCRICNAMCGLIVSVEGATVTKIRGDDDHALSLGYSCPKGRALGTLHHDARRLNHPSVRTTQGPRRESWTAALDSIAEQLSASIAEHGPDSVAMYLASGSAFDTAGRRAAERFLSLLGSRQKYTATTIDTPSKPLIAELVGGWSGLTPIWDHESGRLLVLFGTNPVVSHGHSNAIPDPIRRLRGFQSKGGQLWVVDPRRTETASFADHHIQTRPGTDWLLLGWLVRRLLHEHPGADSLDSRATNSDELRAYVAAFDDDFVTHGSGASIDQLELLLSAILRAGRVSALTGTGVSMSATANAAEYLLWALHIVTDSYDQPGGMWFNPGYLMQLGKRSLPVSDGTPEPGPRSRPSLPRRFGEYPCAALIPEIEAGNIRALLVVGGNPITAFPDVARTTSALESLSALIVIDILPTETTQLATHVLPAVDQLERADLTWLLDTYQLAVAAQHTDAVVAPLAERKPLWWMFGSLSERLGLSLLPNDLSLDAASDQTFLDPLIARSSDAISLRESPSLAVASGPVYGWVTENVLPNGKWRLEVPGIANQLELHRISLRESSQTKLRLIPHRRLRMMNSQFRSLETAAGDDETEEPKTQVTEAYAIHASASVVEALGSPSFATLTTSTGSVKAPLVSDQRLHDECVTLNHGWDRFNVCSLTSVDENVDPLSGMVLQSGVEVTLNPET